MSRPDKRPILTMEDKKYVVCAGHKEVNEEIFICLVLSTSNFNYFYLCKS